ncbi:exodeoxyribonuclease VII small subunit [Helicobacter anseris]|uniref:Exodeoxyribonuclease 7 small subunit n=1 Tax=Helicobacter anseris TaxID=375926 RepID=A0A3D8JAK4_9HELI|nr:exodeoxyribonuclease VII small subunit [Helicobacter anseris]RDU74106.1 exodeoxyribonuclease VII small subunit [Helicobacter anseris]
MKSFEEKIECIKEILTKLNANDLNLKDGVSLYKEGLKQLNEAQEMLEKAQLEYEEIKNTLKDKN